MQSVLYKEPYDRDGQVAPMVAWAMRLARWGDLVWFAAGLVFSMAYYC